ncbi:MAG: type II toxin-antitoxin system HigB family toxin [Alphaproteobacteria bacterium]|nr:type II toxin-antitoxin system HigB family toxin [Alphaproteobacteria bacterium]
MRIISRKCLKDFWDINPDSEEHLKAWYQIAKEADWKTPQEVKEQYRNASILRDGRVVFNIRGNKYRLIVWINYEFFTIYIRFVGTHEQYDDTDVQTI